MTIFSVIFFTHAAPFQSPLDFRVTASTFHSATLEWNMPPLASWNGILTHYSMTYTLINSAASPCNHSLNESRVVPVDLRRNVETVDDLIPFTQYWFQISAATRAGEGPVASLLCNTTQAGKQLCLRQPSLLMQQL